MGDDIEEDEEPIDEEPPAVEDNRPRTDIAPLITDALIAEINDKNWKVCYACFGFYTSTMYIMNHFWTGFILVLLSFSGPYCLHRSRAP